MWRSGSDRQRERRVNTVCVIDVKTVYKPTDELLDTLNTNTAFRVKCLLNSKLHKKQHVNVVIEYELI